MGEDLDLWGRIALQYPVVFSWRTGGVYHQDAENRACDRFTEEDEHPFVETCRSLEEKERSTPRFVATSNFMCAGFNWKTPGSMFS